MESNPHNADMTDDPAPGDEQLVAYLDGELDDESSRRIEERLATDSMLRDQLGRLERTWDALDELGQVEVDESFTQTTIEMVALVAEEERRREDQDRPVRRRRQWLVGSVGLIMACLAGFGAAWVFWPNPNRQLIDDLPVLEHLDEYQQIDEIEFLELLYENRKLFSEVPSDDDA